MSNQSGFFGEIMVYFFEKFEPIRLGLRNCSLYRSRYKGALARLGIDLQCALADFHPLFHADDSIALQGFVWIQVVGNLIKPKMPIIFFMIYAAQRK